MTSARCSFHGCGVKWFEKQSFNEFEAPCGYSMTCKPTILLCRCDLECYESFMSSDADEIIKWAWEDEKSKGRCIYGGAKPVHSQAVVRSAAKPLLCLQSSALFPTTGTFAHTAGQHGMRLASRT